MKWSDFQNKNVALLGAGMENLGLISHLKKAGAQITLCDSDKAIASQLGENGIKLQLGEGYLARLERFDFVFRSPGLPVSVVESALEKANKKPIITSAMDLFLSLHPCITVGITGTKGKGTTATMLGEILKAAGKHVVVAGNIGTVVFDVFDQLSSESIVVLELSSFQLEDINHSPDVAVVLPISEDHLKPLSARSPNYHASMNDYVAAKGKITVYQSADDVLIFAADNEHAAAIATVSKAKKVSVSQLTVEADLAVNEQGQLFVHGEYKVDLANLGLRGRHVFLNAAIASAAALELGVTEQDIGVGLAAFKPLPHRLQTVAVKEGVTYVDDSYATAPEAAEAALSAFTAPIVLIAGGSSKGASFDSLAEAINKSSVKTIVLLGEEAPKIQDALKGANTRVNIVDGGDSMKSVVSKARSFAKEGEVVLLSPGCASKDMFRDAADRGDQFQKAVNEISD